MTQLSKLQSEAVLEFDKEFGGLYKDSQFMVEADINDFRDIKQFLSDQIQKAYEAGIKEVLRNVEYNAQTKIWDIPEEKLLSIQSKEK